MERKLAYLAIALVFVLGLFVGLWLRGLAPGQPALPDKPDTVYVDKPVFIDKPVPVEVTPKGYELVPAGTIDRITQQIRALEDSLEAKPRIVVRDSLIYIDVPMEQKHYGDSTYDAWVSGYHPALDSLRFNQQTAIVEVPVYKVKKQRWSIGVHGGWGVTVDPFGGKVSIHTGPTISVGLNYNF